VTQVEYQQWWQYHIRVARGETLTAEEEAIYRTGIDALDQEEAEQLQLASLKNLRQLRAQIQQLSQNLEQFTARHEQLNRKIAEMEQTYQRLTGYSLLTDAHVPS
jgi:predicted RNase H-like nuclease (RuvC/YqgF family)